MFSEATVGNCISCTATFPFLSLSRELRSITQPSEVQVGWLDWTSSGVTGVNVLLHKSKAPMSCCVKLILRKQVVRVVADKCPTIPFSSHQYN
jgi:hypothetical protein